MKKSFFAILFVASALCGVNSLRAQTIYEPYSFSTYAGSALVVGSTNGPRNQALFNAPSGVAVDRNGDTYVADTGNHTIRKIAGGVVSTLAGLPGMAGSDDGTGATARFFDPTGVAVDNALNVYVADSGNHTIRKISPEGVVTTLAGMAGLSGSANGTGDVARFNGPRGVSVDSASNIYVADTFNHTIRKISPGGAVTTLAGFPLAAGSANGTADEARFTLPRGVAVDSSFNVYVADSGNNMIRKITSGAVVTTVAGAAGMFGSSDGMGAAARFFTPIGIAVNGSGVLFVADADNQLIRKIAPSTDVTTLGGAPGSSGSTDGTGGSARFNTPQGVAVDSRGNLYVGDTGNSTIRLGQQLPKADFNSDGRTDYVLFNASTRKTALWFLENNIKIGSAYGPTPPAGWKLVDAADFDGDGNPDYALFNPGTRRTAIWYMSGVIFARGLYGPTIATGYAPIRAADFNGDGKPDLLLYNASTGRTALWYLNDNIFQSSAYGPIIPSGWKPVDVGDFDGDGQFDYALFSPGTRKTAIWYLSGPARRGSAYGPTVASGYELAGTADFDGNGKPDYLLSNGSTGRTAMWYLNGNVFAGSAYGPTLPAGWSIAAP